MMKKGQILGQPIMYIFFAIVAVLILGFGIKMAVDLKDFGDDVTSKVFFEDIEKKINSVYSDSYGSVVSLNDLKIPSEFREICFLDSSESDIDLSLVNNEDLRKIINSSYDSLSEKNVFAIGESLEIREFDKLDLDVALVCDDLIDGKIDVKLINGGQVVKAQHI